MKAILPFFLACLLTTTTTSPVLGQTGPSVSYGNNSNTGSFKNINGIRLYYEIYGTGRPLLLLHGSGGSIRNAKGRIEFFKQHFQVIAVDSRGHGKSVDTTTEAFTYLQMALDIKALLDSLNIDSAFVQGQSDGGILGLLLAIHFPKKIARLATWGANTFPGKKAVFDEIDNLVLDSVKTTKNSQMKRLYSLLAYQPNITDDELRKIQCPVLVMSGDRDAIRLEHSVKIFTGIPNANFFVMPGATHYGTVEKPGLFNLVVLDFFTCPFSKVSTVELLTGKH